MKHLNSAPTLWNSVAIASVIIFLIGDAWVNTYRPSAPVCHETGRLAAGLTYWRNSDFSSFKVNPPLPSLVAALPVLALPNVKIPVCRPDWPPQEERFEYIAGREFVTANREMNRVCVRIGRLSMSAFLLVGCWAVSRFTHRLFGPCSACFAVVMLVSSPFVLGHGTLISHDIPSAFMGVLAISGFLAWWERPTAGSMIVAGAAIGIAELCKFTLLVFYPLIIVLWLAIPRTRSVKLNSHNWLREGIQLCGILLVSVCVINCGYLFEKTFTPLGEFRFHSTLFTGDESLECVPACGANPFAGTWLGKMPIPLPANMIQGIDTQRCDFERGMPSYMRGEWSDHGWWYYYAYALLLKVPLGTWGLLGIALYASAFLDGYNASWQDEMVVILPGLTLFLFVSSQTGFSVHSRYIIPAIPFLVIWGSKIGRAFSSEQYKRSPRITLVVRGLILLFLGWSISSSLAAYPHNISYFNELAAILPTRHDSMDLEQADPNPAYARTSVSVLTRIHTALTVGMQFGPRHLLDSNVDWGQDIFFLEEWCKKHPEAKPLRLAYWGTYPVTFTSINTEGTPPVGPCTDFIDTEKPRDEIGPLPGWYALSVNELYSRNNRYRYFLRFKPIDMAGYSILIYDITTDDANRARRELGLPELGSKGGRPNAVRHSNCYDVITVGRETREAGRISGQENRGR